jgi:hypothetical protein
VRDQEGWNLKCRNRDQGLHLVGLKNHIHRLGLLNERVSHLWRELGVGLMKQRVDNLVNRFGGEMHV